MYVTLKEYYKSVRQCTLSLLCMKHLTDELSFASEQLVYLSY